MRDQLRRAIKAEGRRGIVNLLIGMGVTGAGVGVLVWLVIGATELPDNPSYQQLAVVPTNVVYSRETGTFPPMPPCGRARL